MLWLKGYSFLQGLQETSSKGDKKGLSKSEFRNLFEKLENYFSDIDTEDMDSNHYLPVEEELKLFLGESLNESNEISDDEINMEDHILSRCSTVRVVSHPNHPGNFDLVWCEMSRLGLVGC